MGGGALGRLDEVVSALLVVENGAIELTAGLGSHAFKGLGQDEAGYESVGEREFRGDGREAGDVGPVNGKAGGEQMVGALDVDAVAGEDVVVRQAGASFDASAGVDEVAVWLREAAWRLGR